MSVGRMNMLSCYILYLIFGTGGFEQELARVGTILQYRCTLEIIQGICYIWSLRLVFFLNVDMSCKNTLAVCPSRATSRHSVIVDALSLNRSKCFCMAVGVQVVHMPSTRLDYSPPPPFMKGVDNSLPTVFSQKK